METKYSNQQVKSFECDQHGIDRLKEEFFENAEDFVYYRKGEWEGISAILEFVQNYLSNHPEIVISAIGVYPAIKILKKDVKHKLKQVKESMKNFIDKYSTNKKKPEQVTCRVITSLTEDNKKHIPKWEKLCGKGGVCIIPEEQSGYFRYFVNEKEFCLFCRIDDNTLQGIRGDNPMIIKMLRDKFDEEFFIGKYLYGKNEE